MGCCGNDKPEEKQNSNCCSSSRESNRLKPKLVVPAGKTDCPIDHFRDTVKHCLDYAEAQKKAGAKIVGIMCEYTPRELIMAAGGVPICLCGGSAEMVQAAEKDLPSNLCALIKSTFGYSVKKACPFLEMADLVVAETTCDGKKKMYELLAERYPMCVLELPQKSEDPDSFERWVTELRKFKAALEKQFSVEITDEKLKKAIHSMNEDRRLKRELAGLMKRECPPLTGRELLGMRSLIAAVPEDMEQYKQTRKLLDGRKLDPPAESRVRVLLTGVPLPRGAERVMNIIEENGGLVVCQENCSGIKPVLEDVDAGTGDLIRALAAKYYHLPCSVMTRNDARIDQLRNLAEEYKVQCVIELVWQACLTYDVESYFVKKLAEDELKIPYLKIETDYSPSDTVRIAMRVQALFETVNERAVV